MRRLIHIGQVVLFIFNTFRWKASQPSISLCVNFELFYCWQQRWQQKKKVVFRDYLIIKQEDLLDLITALLKFNCFLILQSQRSAYSKAILDDSLITVDTTSLDQLNLYYYTISRSPYEISDDVITSSTCHNMGLLVTRRKKKRKKNWFWTYFQQIWYTGSWENYPISGHFSALFVISPLGKVL